jgi:hypothetical protein
MFILKNNINVHFKNNPIFLNIVSIQKNELYYIISYSGFFYFDIYSFIF